MSIDLIALAKSLWDKIRHGQTKRYPTFWIDDTHIIGHKSKITEFRMNEAYFELKVAEQFLRYARQFWNEYNPLTVVFTEFIYDKKERPFPFVVGPETLKGLEQLEGTESIRYSNTRVAGPTPYRGDTVTIFVGFFGVRTRNWAMEALSLLESFAKAFDTTKLTAYLDIAGPLIKGIDSFFGMANDFDFRIGSRNVYSDPETPAGDIFRPGYFAMIRSDRPLNAKDFWVKGSQLHVGASPGKLTPYMDYDYVLFQIAAHDKRNDYTTFPFHEKWEEVQKLIWAGVEGKANEQLMRVFGLIKSSPDLIPSHANKLVAMYRSWYQKNLSDYKKSVDPTLSPGRLGEEAFARSFEVLAAMDVGSNIVQTLGASQNLFSDLNSRKPRLTGPTPMTEADIEEALTSETLSVEALTSADTEQLSEAFTFAIPFRP